MTGGREDHADYAQRHATHRALKGDDPHPATDVHELVNLVEGVIHDHDTGRFCGHVAILSNCHADSGGHHRRCVVDAVTNVERFGGGCFLADDGQLFLRTLLGEDFGNTHLLGEVANLRLAISRYDHHPLELMLRTQMSHEGKALRARRIPEAQGRRVALVNYHHALKSTGNRRKLISAKNFLRDHLVTAGDLHLMTGNRSTQSLARLLADVGGLRNLNPGLLRRRQDRARQRMLRVTLQTCHERQHFLLGEARGDELFGQFRFAISERPGLVENRGSAPGDLFKHDGALDDDRPAGTEGNRADDGDRYGEEQWARRGDYQHRQEANSFSTDDPGEEATVSATGV